MAATVNWRQVGHWVAGGPSCGAPQRGQGVAVMHGNVAQPRHQIATRAWTTRNSR
jgi:hypothetical protein